MNFPNSPRSPRKNYAAVSTITVVIFALALVSRVNAQLSSQRVGKSTTNLTAGFSFDGPVGPAGSPGFALDPNGAVGPTHFVFAMNSVYAIYLKSTGALLSGYPKNLTSLFPSTQQFQPCTSVPAGTQVDPIVKFDNQPDTNGGRWIISYGPGLANVASPVCVAVSQTSDPTGAWYTYIFNLPSSDYQKIGMWPDAYYISTNLEDPNHPLAPIGGICALDRTNMLINGTVRQPQCFTAPHFVAPTDIDESGSTLAPPTGAPNYAVEIVPATGFLSGGVSNQINIYGFKVDWNVPTNSSLAPLPGSPFTVASYVMPCVNTSTSFANDAACLPQLSASAAQTLMPSPMDAMNRVSYRRFADGHESLIFSHTIQTQNGPTWVSGIKWYEFRNLATTPTIYQEGFYSGGDGSSRFDGTLAMDKQGNIGLGFAVTGAAVHPGFHYTGWRNNNDSSERGLMNAGETVLVDGGGNSIFGTWGDYFSMNVDPFDECTFWVTGMYSNASASVSRIGSFKFPSCTNATNDFHLVVQPPASTIIGLQPVGAVYTVTPVASGTSGSQTVQLNVTGLPSGTSVSWSPSSTVGTGTAVQMVLTATGAVTGPNQTFTITGTSGATQHAALADVTVYGSSISNGGFESGGFFGNLTGWNAATGTVTALNTGSPHSGGWYARLGTATGATSRGDNILSQTFLVPGTANQHTNITLWYRPACRGGFNNDLDTVQLTDTSGTVLQTLLSECTNTGTWTQLGPIDITAQQGKIVVLKIDQSNNDDRNGSTLDIDDVSVVAN